MVKIRNVIKKKDYVPPIVETIIVESCSLLEASVELKGTGDNQEADDTTGDLFGGAKVNYTNYTGRDYFDEYSADGYDDIDDILNRLR